MSSVGTGALPQLPEVTAAIEHAVAAGDAPGAVVLVRADGRTVHHSAHGVLDAHSGYALRPDTVLWVASLAKPVGAAAVLALADDGLVGLLDPVSTYLPEFSAPGRVRVLRPGSPSPFTRPFGPPPDPLPEYDVVAAERELTIVDLLTHTGGLQGIAQWNPEFVRPGMEQTLAEYVPTLGGLVRDCQPGQAWAYSNSASYDVLSRIVEIASGQSLDDVLRQRFFEPLGMRTAGFGRVGTAGAMPLPAPFVDDAVAVGRCYRTTSAGLWASATDYLAFAEMLRAGGGGILTADSVERMTSNQVGDLFPGLTGRGPAAGLGFGLGVAVVDDPVAAGEALPRGTFGWDGMTSRRFWVCPDGGWSMFCYAPGAPLQRQIESAVVAALG